VEQAQSLRLQFVGEKAHASEVATWPIEASDEAETDGVGTGRVVNTIGIVVVARLAANADGVFATMTAT
jgi:hypothetical protein